MAKTLKDKNLKHNIRFIWCGSEERGLLGSKDYVAKHKDELDQIKLVVNIDMIGSILGHRIAVSTADISLVHYIDYYAKMVGFPLESSQGVYSSDSTPFADAGVPHSRLLEEVQERQEFIVALMLWNIYHQRC